MVSQENQQIKQIKTPFYENLIAKGLIPDFLLRLAIRSRLRSKLHEMESEGSESEQAFLSAHIATLKSQSIAIETQAANDQHYELPPIFFDMVLGKHRKYSSGYWQAGDNLDSSEERMLALTAERAQIKPGLTILDVGCGWGSLSLYLSAKFPTAQITALSNSKSQKQFIERQALERGLTNLVVITANAAKYDSPVQFDRIVSVEMFEHVRNYELFFRKLSSWLKPEGLLFTHVFCHRKHAYLFEADGPQDWMARYFFAGGQMPSYDLFLHFQQDLQIVERWFVPGRHYHLTCEAWLKKIDAQKRDVMLLFKDHYRDDALKFFHYWRIFFLACSELFAFDQGREWIVGHYLFKKHPSDRNHAKS